MNLQLLASCYLQNNQAYCAYHILKGRFILPIDDLHVLRSSAVGYWLTFCAHLDFKLYAIIVLCIILTDVCSSTNHFCLSLLLHEGTQMAQSRYLFALSCFKMDLLNEAEAALCPANEPSSEVLDWLLFVTTFIPLLFQKQFHQICKWIPIKK